jgi:ADP-heptose:LPS heptosyltransferase
VESVLEQLERGSRVAVLRLRSLGDCVLTTPALDILKRSRPDLQVAVVVEEGFSEIFQGNPDVFVVLGRQFVPLRVWRPHLCINFHGGQRSARLTAFSGARFRAGFEHYRHGWAYNIRIPRAQQILGVERKVHTAEHLASAVFYLGVERCEIPRAKLIADGRSDIPQPYAVIHPFATGKGKAWPADRFLAVAEHLTGSGLEPVFIGAATDDASPFAPYRTVRGARLSEIKRLLSGASLFIGNDSGPAHMAAAFGLPVVVLFGVSDPAVWSPWRTASEVLISKEITRIELTQVLDALARLRVHA